MSSVQDELQKKTHIIRKCLAQRFHDVAPHTMQLECFVFNDSVHSFQFGFFRPALDELPEAKLEMFMETEVIPMIVQNPGMQTFLAVDGFSIRNKVEPDRPG